MYEGKSLTSMVNESCISGGILKACNTIVVSHSSLCDSLAESDIFPPLHGREQMMKKSGMDNDVNQALVDLLESHNNLEWEDQDDAGELYSSDEEGGLSSAVSMAFVDDGLGGPKRVPSRRASVISSKRSSISGDMEAPMESAPSGSQVLPRPPMGMRVGAANQRRRSTELRQPNDGGPTVNPYSSGLYNISHRRGSVDEGDSPSLMVGRSAVSFSNGALSSPLLDDATILVGRSESAIGVGMEGRRAPGGLARRTRRPSLIDMGLQPGQSQHEMPSATSGDSDDSVGKSSQGTTLADNHSGPLAKIKSTRYAEVMVPEAHSSQSGPLPTLSTRMTPNSVNVSVNLFQSLSLRHTSGAAAPSPPAGPSPRAAGAVCPYRRSEDVTRSLDPSSQASSPSTSSALRPSLRNPSSVPLLGARSSSPGLPLLPTALSRLLLDPLPTPRVSPLNKTHSGHISTPANTPSNGVRENIGDLGPPLGPPPGPPSAAVRLASSPQVPVVLMSEVRRGSPNVAVQLTQSSAFAADSHLSPRGGQELPSENDASARPSAGPISALRASASFRRGQVARHASFARLNVAAVSGEGGGGGSAGISREARTLILDLMRRTDGVLGGPKFHASIVEDEEGVDEEGLGMTPRIVKEPDDKASLSLNSSSPLDACTAHNPKLLYLAP